MAALIPSQRVFRRIPATKRGFAPGFAHLRTAAFWELLFHARLEQKWEFPPWAGVVKGA